MPYPEIRQNILEIHQRMAEAAAISGRSTEDIELMAVTKTVSFERINAAYDSGVRLFGENRVQEYLGKYEQYCFDVNQVHFIGHLQTNKVKYIIDKVSMIESVDSIRLAKEIEQRAAAAGIVMPILLEVNIASEATKSGIPESGLSDAVAELAELSHVCLRGFMCIPEQGNGEYYFAKMKDRFETMRTLHPELALSTLSMGMTNDYEAAIRHGSTLVRVGSGIFGARNYN